MTAGSQNVLMKTFNKLRRNGQLNRGRSHALITVRCATWTLRVSKPTRLSTTTPNSTWGAKPDPKKQKPSATPSIRQSASTHPVHLKLCDDNRKQNPFAGNQDAEHEDACHTPAETLRQFKTTLNWTKSICRLRVQSQLLTLTTSVTSAQKRRRSKQLRR